jgi:HEAT repeat protein
MPPLNAMTRRMACRFLFVAVALICAGLPIGCGRTAPVPSEAKVNATAVPELIRGLQSPDPTARARSAASLGRIGPDAKGAVPALTTALKDTDPAVQAAAAYSLGQIGPDAGEALAELEPLTRRDGPLREVAAKAVSRIKP